MHNANGHAAADLREYSTRSARGGLAITARDHRVAGYKVSKEWATLTEAEREKVSLAAFKRGSRCGFLEPGGCWAVDPSVGVI